MTGTGEPTVSACSFIRVSARAVLLGLSLVLRWRPAVPSTITQPSPPPTLKRGALGPSKPKARLVPTLVTGGDRKSGIAKAKVIPGPNHPQGLEPLPGPWSACCPGAGHYGG